MSLIKNIYDKMGVDATELETLTIGYVVDANDPQQMGRLRVRCPAWGERADMLVKDVPWASYITPFGGSIAGMARGPEKSSLNSNVGEIAYGMWAIPKVGAHVLVACIDGDPSMRVWLGCLFDQYSPHTMPHGRFNENAENVPIGPLSSSGNYIQPLNENNTKAFTDISAAEFKTRAADYTVSAVDPKIVSKEYIENDDIEGSKRQGYEKTRAEPNYQSDETGENLDSQTYSITTPGFHSLSMDDRVKNCRIRFRTSAGHQIIMDDSNERMYISTAEGNNWLELDQNGNIDVYSSRRVSIHAESDINITSDEKIRMYGKKGVHIQTDEEIRLRAKKDIVIKTDENTREYAKKKIIKESANDEVLIKAKKDLRAQSQANVQVTGDKNVAVTASGGKMDLKSGSNLIIEGSQIDLNGPPASTASKPSTKEPKDANLPNREPKHEPWPRVMYKKDGTDKDQAPTQEVEFASNSDEVGKKEQGETIKRGPNWRR